VPIKGQGGVADFKLDVRNGSGDFVDPTNLTLTFKDSLGSVQTGFPVAFPGLLTKVAVGKYEYDWPVPADFPIGSYTAQWDGILLGAPDVALEQWEIVPAGSMSASGFDFLIKPDDFDAIRGLLGVTTLDVEDSDIELVAFGPQAEMLVKRRISSWAILVTDPDIYFILRIATIYQTACLMARSFVRGGTIGLARPLSTGEGRDWGAAADQFCAQYEYWVNIADQSDPDADNNTDYEIDPLVVSGPTSVRIARRHSRSTTSDPSVASWWQYPPLWR
jgi:hypothetical protein